MFFGDLFISLVSTLPCYAQFHGALGFFGFKKYHWLWLVNFGCSLVTCLFLWFQLGLAAAFKERERVCVTKERLLLFSKREIKRANQEDIMLAQWKHSKFCTN